MTASVLHILRESQVTRQQLEMRDGDDKDFSGCFCQKECILYIALEELCLPSLEWQFLGEMDIRQNTASATKELNAWRERKRQRLNIEERKQHNTSFMTSSSDGYRNRHTSVSAQASRNTLLGLIPCWCLCACDSIGGPQLAIGSPLQCHLAPITSCGKCRELVARIAPPVEEP